MITAVDTNILLDILVANEHFYEASGDALEEAAGEGSIVISDIVYAELCIHFETQRECDAFLESNEIRGQALMREAHLFASRAWWTYRQRRSKRTRILADFLIWRSRSEAGYTPTFQGSRLLSEALPVAGSG